MEANMSLYELNRSIIDQQGPLPEEEIVAKWNLIKTFSKETNNKYYMLYGREINYFTLFAKVENWELQFLELGVFECLANIGTPYSIELTEQKDAIEIWVKTIQNEQEFVTCLYLFPYDNGVVRIGE